MHVALRSLIGETVDLLRVTHRPQGCDGQRLGLSAREQSGTVGAGQHANLDGDVAHVLEAAAVDANPFLHDTLADAVLQRLVEELAEDLCVLREPLAELDDRLPAQVIDVGLARGLVRLVQDLVQAQGQVFANDLDHLLGIGGRDPLTLLAPDLLLQLQLGRADVLDLGVSHVEGVEHDLLRHTLGTSFDHQDRVGCAGDHQVELRLVNPRHRRVDDNLPVQVSHADCANGATERDVRDHQGRRSPVDAEDRRVVLLVHRQDG